MKLEKVLRKARNGLIGLGLAGALMVGGGCASLSSSDWDSLAFMMGALARDKDKTEEQRESAAYIEQIAKEQAQKEHEKDLADRSRDEGDEVNVYVGEQKKEKEIVYVEREKEPELNRYFFACNYWKDFNGDGAANYPDEYVGIKNKFGDDEKISLVSHDEKGKKGQRLRMEIYNSSGEIIIDHLKRLRDNGSMVTVADYFDMTNWLIQNGGYGNFKAVWYLDDKYAGSTEFEIVPSN